MNWTLPLEQTIALVRQFRTRSLMLRDFFMEVPLAGNTANWTIYPNSRARAKYVRFGDPADPVARRGMSHRQAMMAHIRLSKAFKPSDRRVRRPGSDTTSERWALEDQIADEMQDINLQIEATKEYERAGILFGGVVSIAYGDGTYDVVDYLTSRAETWRHASVEWNTPTANILGDLSSCTHATRIHAGITPTDMICGEGALENLILNTVLQNYMKESPDGIRAITEGRYPRLKGMNIREYGEGYSDAETAAGWTPYVPAGHIALVPSPQDMGTIVLQGDADDLDAPPNNPGRFSKTYRKQDPSRHIVIVDDVSLAAIEVPGAICVIDTLNTS